MKRLLVSAIVGWGLALSAHAGLLAYYPFDSNFNDVSGNGNHLTVGGGTPDITSTAGEFVFGGSALNLAQASDEYLTPTSNLSFAVSDAWSVSFWARRRSGTAVATGMVVGDNTTTDSFIWLSNNSSTVQGLRFRPVGVGTTVNVDYTTGHDSSFHHWVVVANGTGTIRVYRDNVDLGTRSPSGGTDFLINAIGSGYTGTTQIFDGQIDELRIYNEALDAAAAAALFAGPTGDNPPTLAANDIVDDQNGGPVKVGTMVTYTLTFSEDMDATTVDASDFGNAGNATFTIGAITEVAPGVFTVEITPTSVGSLQLEVLASAGLYDASGNPLETTAALPAETVITVEAAPTPTILKQIRVFLIGGQSNADGRADPAGLPTSPVNLQLPQSDVDYFESSLTTLRPLGQFGPEITMGRRLADSIGDGTTARVALIKYGVGGTSLSTDWKAGGTATTAGDGARYVTFQQTVTNGMAALAAAYPDATLAIEGMLWVQGERDVVIGTHNAYEANLSAFIADVRATYGSDLPFIISRLSSGQTSLDAARLAVVRTAQTAVAAADPLSALLDTDGFGIQSDELHFDAAGQQQLGNRGAMLLLDFRAIVTPLDFVLTSGGMVEAALDNAFPGFGYTLQRNPTLTPNQWQDLETIIAAGRHIAFAPFAEAEERDFFRVKRTLVP